MSKYQNLGNHLRSQPFAEVPMTFREIEQVIGAKLPPKAQQHRAWWSNSPSNNVMTKVWLDAGFKSEQVDVQARKLVFRRVEKSAKGMADEARNYQPQSQAKKKKSHQHPLIGAMKGTFWIDPEWDLTKPTMSRDELDEMDANLDRTADLIEAGMSRDKKR